MLTDILWEGIARALDIRIATLFIFYPITINTSIAIS